MNGPNQQRRSHAVHNLSVASSLTSARVGFGAQLLAGDRHGLGHSVTGGYTLPLSAGKQRVVSNAHNSQLVPGAAARQEGDLPLGDRAVDEMYDHLGSTYDFFFEVFGRNSLDGVGLR